MEKTLVYALMLQCFNEILLKQYYTTLGGVIYTEKLDNIYSYLKERLHNHCMTHILGGN
jgi:hypothetical protein